MFSEVLCSEHGMGITPFQDNRCNPQYTNNKPQQITDYAYKLMVNVQYVMEYYCMRLCLYLRD